MDRAYRLKYAKEYRLKNIEKRRLYNERNKEKIKKQQKEYHRVHRLELKEKRINLYRENPEKYLARTRDWRIGKHDHLLSYGRKYWGNRKKQMSQKNKRKYDKLRGMVFDVLGRACAKCGYASDIRALQVDHIKNDGFSEMRRGNSGGITKAALYKKIIEFGAQGRYQILCANCNWIKHIEHRESLHSL